MIGLTVLAYANSLSGGFVLDSRILVLADPRLRALSSASLSNIFAHTYWWPYAETPLYRPLTTLSFLLNYSVLGGTDHAVGYHVVNLILHLGNVMLVWTLARRLIRRPWLAAAAAAVWAVHPLGTEAVTNIVGRADLLSTFGVLLAFLAYVQAAESDASARGRWMLVTLLGTLIATLSKESAVALVGVVVLFDLTRAPRPQLSSVIVGWSAVAAPILLFLAVRSHVVVSTSADAFPFVDNPILGASFLQGRWTAVTVLGRYVALWLWPAKLSADYSFQQIPLATGAAADWLFTLLLIAAVAAAAASVRLGRIPFFCAAAAFILLLPASNLIYATGTIMAERLMYLPAAFLVLAIGSACDTLDERLPGPVVLAAVGVIALVFAARTFTRNADWRDELTLWTATVRSAPASFKAHSGLAEAVRQSDPSGAQHDRVIAEKTQSLAILAGAPRPEQNAKALYEAATYHMERAEWRASHPSAGAPTPGAEDYREAIALAERFLALKPPESDAAEARRLLSVAYRETVQGGKAVEMAEQAAAARPFDPMSYSALASSLVAVNRQDDAAQQLMTGFMVTGNPALRAALIDLYRGGLDADKCAVTETASNVLLNQSCTIVRRHLCSAALESSRIHQAAGHADLAARARASLKTFNCDAIRVP